MKKLRVDAYVTPSKQAQLASPLDGMPQIKPPVQHAKLVEKSEPGKLPVRQQASMPTNRQASMTASQHTGISQTSADSDELTEKETFRCRRSEVIAINRLKDDLFDSWDLRTSKQNLERYAIEILIADYDKRGEQSEIVTLLKKKRPSP